ncbi:MAG: PIN domain-containing protein [Firmicutes bacterium]|nr:PIN domain-containing protein [Bacillota bacterium]
MTRYLVDTDVLIWVLRGKPEAIAWVEAAAMSGELWCSALTVSEILRMVREDELPKTEALLDSLQIAPGTAEDARHAAHLLRHRGPGFVDCHIAATALRLHGQF